jgi:hypothetical protein
MLWVGSPRLTVSSSFDDPQASAQRPSGVGLVRLAVTVGAGPRKDRLRVIQREWPGGKAAEDERLVGLAKT